jgi:two-component system, NarL family, invasion response regulator UvrY
VIRATGGFEPVADVASGLEALRSADHACPHLVLMDVHMPEMDGFETARRLTAAHPEAIVVLVSLDDLEDLTERVTACGAVAFLHKRDLGPATLRALWSAHGTSC